MNSVLDNFKGNKVGDFLKEQIKPEAQLSIVSAYFTIYAYEKMKTELESIKKLRFLFGEPTFIQKIDPNKVNTRDFKIEDDSLSIPTESQLTQKAIARDCAAWLKEKVEIKSMVKPNFLHGKMYIVDNEGKKNDAAIVGSSNFTVNGLGLGGSPNIELNVKIDSQAQFLELSDWFDELWNNTDGMVEDVKQDVLKYIEQLYQDNDSEFVYFKTLYHVFYDYLTEQDSVNDLDDTGFYDTEIWAKLYDFQRDGVRGTIDKMRKYNGCILADSVGLGKTYEALAVIKYFEMKKQKVLVLCPKKLSNNWTVYQGFKSNKENKFQQDDLRYNVMYHTDMGRTTGRSEADGLQFDSLDWGNYDMVVIDESHNFRGNPMEKVNDEGAIKYNRAKWLMEKIIKSGRETKVLLLSATPVNNNLRDLRNQLYLITGGKNALKIDHTRIPDLAQTLKTAQTVFTNWADFTKNPNRRTSDLLERLDTSFFKLLDGMTIARSRKHITQFYDLTQIGQFPKREKPISISPKIDLKDRFPSYENISEQISDFKLSIYNPSAYVTEANKSKYGIKTDAEIAADTQDKAKAKKKNQLIIHTEPNFDQNQREYFLIGMMKVNYLKRMESSINSFSISIDRTIEKITTLQNNIELYKKTRMEVDISNDIVVANEFDKEDDDYTDPNEINAESGFDTKKKEKSSIKEAVLAPQVGKKLKFSLADIDLDAWLKDLKRDKDTLLSIYNNAAVITANRDAKLDALKKLIANKVNKPKNGANKKIIIFTAFADTAKYIYDNLKPLVITDLKLNIARIAGSDTETSFGKNEFNTILTHFSPISKERKIKDGMAHFSEEIDILVATDCISEGQNLQDCDYLINYDIHWNPVRVIQRFGRIDRLGSQNKTIHLINFWPTPDLDKYINLKHRVEARMALVDITATGEDNILNTEQIEDIIKEDLKFRNEQLKKLKEEVIDLEDMNDSVSLSDFSMQDFRQEIRNYFQENINKLRNAPLGLFAIVPSPTGEHADYYKPNIFSDNLTNRIKSGVIYCLRMKNELQGGDKTNPTHPYFLIYIYNDGQVRFSFTGIKPILEIFKALCVNQKQAIESLCDIFNNETNQGKNMEQYTDLLKKALAHLNADFKQKLRTSLSSDPFAVIQKRTDATDMSKLDNFELITWLIIK